MGSFRVRTRLLTAVTAGAAMTIGMAGVGAGAAPAAVGQPAAKATHAPLHGYTTVRGLSNVNRAAIEAQSAAGATIPLWTNSVTAPGGPYTYQMVGKSPFVHALKPQASVKTPVIPVIFHFADGTTSDPTVADACSGSLSAQALTLGSPILGKHTYKLGGTKVGTGQYLDEFQRANFWSTIHGAANNPTYAVNLKPTSTITVTFNAAQAATFSPLTDFFGPAPCGHLWQIDINKWDAYVQGTLIPSLASQGVSPKTFPLFLFYNVVLYGNGNPNQCCILGYHGAYLNGSGTLQTYSTTEYDTEGGFGPGINDTSIMAHEVGEWMDDPTVGNATPNWGNIGQVNPGCQNNLEVGDPLTGTIISVSMPNGHTYHLQELAFFSWFYDQVPSIAVNGWYSSNNTFTADAAMIAVC